jgi:hypothetical protein
MKEEALARVLALGLFDYMRKSRSQGFFISLAPFRRSNGWMDYVSPRGR